MATTDDAKALLKRLKKIQRAQARLAAISTRVNAQADTVTDLIERANALVADFGGSRGSASTTKSGAAKRRSSATPKSGAKRRSTATTKATPAAAP
jgi:hypothetical protein